MKKGILIFLNFCISFIANFGYNFFPWIISTLVTSSKWKTKTLLMNPISIPCTLWQLLLIIFKKNDFVDIKNIIQWAHNFYFYFYFM
jgi:hypothetical protein